MTNDEMWTKMMRYFDMRFGQVDERINIIHEKLDEHLTIMMGLAGMQDDAAVEHAALSAQVDRHDVRIQKLARHLGVTLPA